MTIRALLKKAMEEGRRQRRHYYAALVRRAVKERPGENPRKVALLWINQEREQRGQKALTIWSVYAVLGGRR
jgi:hypothetical protein